MKFERISIQKLPRRRVCKKLKGATIMNAMKEATMILVSVQVVVVSFLNREVKQNTTLTVTKPLTPPNKKIK